MAAQSIKVVRDRLAIELKRRLGVWEISNDEILRVTDGTFLRAHAELYLALCELWRAITKPWR